jgi:hypothetical protein
MGGDPVERDIRKLCAIHPLTHECNPDHPAQAQVTARQALSLPEKCHAMTLIVTYSLDFHVVHRRM